MKNVFLDVSKPTGQGWKGSFFSVVGILLCFHVARAASNSPGDPESMPKNC